MPFLPSLGWIRWLGKRVKRGGLVLHATELDLGDGRPPLLRIPSFAGHMHTMKEAICSPTPSTGMVGR